MDGGDLYHALSASGSNKEVLRQLIDDHTFDELYCNLHHIAALRMRREPPGNTLQPTALVNELYVKIRGQKAAPSFSKEDLLGLAARMMHQILTDHARRKAADKRGASAHKISFDDSDALSVETADYLLELNEAFDVLAAEAPRKARVVEMKFFLGMTFNEIAEALDIAVITAKTDWEFARAFLRRRMSSTADIETNARR